MSTLQALKAGSKAREAEERVRQERRRNALVLILRHLADHGYLGSLERLQAESHVSLERLDVADNVDLGCVIQEYEEYHEMKFGRKPRIVRRADGGGSRAPTPAGSEGGGGPGPAPPARLPSLPPRSRPGEPAPGAPPCPTDPLPRRPPLPHGGPPSPADPTDPRARPPQGPGTETGSPGASPGAGGRWRGSRRRGTAGCAGRRRRRTRAGRRSSGGGRPWTRSRPPRRPGWCGWPG